MSEISPRQIFLSVVVLCYRSGYSVVPFIEKLHHMLSFFNFEWEIILVGNYIEGSDDETPQVVKALENRLDRVRALAFPKKGMMGWDMRSGLDAAEGEYIAIIDGDGQFPIESIFSCLLKMESEKLDLVKTYRVQREDGVYRKLISRIYNGLFRRLFKTNFHDVNSKPKIILRSKYQMLHLQSDDWFVDAEMMIRAQEIGLKIGEIPIHFYAISDRSSFVKPKAVYEFISNMFRYRFKKAARNQTAPSSQN